MKIEIKSNPNVILIIRRIILVYIYSLKLIAERRYRNCVLLTKFIGKLDWNVQQVELEFERYFLLLQDWGQLATCLPPDSFFS